MRNKHRQKQTFKRFYGKNDSILIIRKQDKVILHTAFVVKPFKKIAVENEKYPYYKKEQSPSYDIEPLLNLPQNLKILNSSLHRLFLPGKVIKKSSEKFGHKSKKPLEELINAQKEEKHEIDVTVSYFFYKIWMEFDLKNTLKNTEGLVKEFTDLMQVQLKPKIESIGKVGRIVGDPLEQLVLYSTYDRKYLKNNQAQFSALVNNYAIIDKNEEFVKNFTSAEGIDIRPSGLFPYPAGLESTEELILGTGQNEEFIGLPQNFSYPLLIAGDKKNREILCKKIIKSTNSKFIILDPRKNLEFDKYLGENIQILELGENFYFNVLSPNFENHELSREQFYEYIGSLIEIIQGLSNSRSENVLLLREVLDFYLGEFQQGQEDTLLPIQFSEVSLGDIETMLTTEPGGLIISDYQLSAIKTIVHDIYNESLCYPTSIAGKKGLEQAINGKTLISFSSSGYKSQKLFLFSFLIQLLIYDSLRVHEGKDEQITVLIDDAELFFQHERDMSFISYLLSAFERSNFNLILSTAYPGHLSTYVFDRTHNRLLGNLKSAKCLRLLSESHGLSKDQNEFIRRMPKDSFLLIREDLFEKPLLLRHLAEEICNYNEKLEEDSNYVKKKDRTPIIPVTAENIDEFKLKKFEHLYPIIKTILEKLSNKANKGINTESLARLFPQFPKHLVEQAILLCELHNLIFSETVDKEGKSGEFWTKITPRGEKCLKNIKLKLLIKAQKQHPSIESEEIENNVKKEQIKKAFIETPVIGVEGTSSNTTPIEKPNEISENNGTKVDQKKRKGKSNLGNKKSEEIILEKDTTETSVTQDDQFNLIDELQDKRRIIKLTSGSTDQNLEKLVTVKNVLDSIFPLLDSEYEQENTRLVKLSNSIKEIFDNPYKMKQVNNDLLERVFVLSLEIIDAIQIRANFGSDGFSDGDDAFVDKLLKKEMESEKWNSFDTSLTVDIDTAETDKSAHTNQKEIHNMLNSRFPSEVFFALEELKNEEKFIQTARTTIANLLKIKMNFFPNLTNKVFLNLVDEFYISFGSNPPFIKSSNLLFEYKQVSKDTQLSQKKSIQMRGEIIETIKMEFEQLQELDDKARTKFVGKVIETQKE